MSDGRQLVRNSAFNMLGLVVPLVIAVVTMPPLIRGLGAERFGILTLAWAAVGYFSLFELGLSRALTHSVSRRFRTPEAEEIPSLFWTTLTLLLALGVVAAVVVWIATPRIVGALEVRAPLVREALTSFHVLASVLPLVLMSAGMRGLMEAHQDFGIVNAIRLPLAGFMFLGPLLVLPFSRSLVPAIVVLAGARLIGWVASLFVCLGRYQYLGRRIVLRRSVIGPLLRYGGWTTVSNIASPIMMYMDRFVIGAVLSVAAVTHYVTPYEVVTKLMIIPGSVFGAMFPAFAATIGTERQRMDRLYDRSQRIVLLLLFPLVLPTIAFAHEGLNLWMGSVLPAASGRVLQWLALGVFMNAIAFPPHTALQSAGRPDLVAGIHVAELPIYAVVLWWLLRQFGLVGVAIAWTMRMTLDAVAHLIVARSVSAASAVFARIPLAVALLGMLVVPMLLPSLTARAIYVVAALGVFLAVTARHLTTNGERTIVLGWLRSGRVFRGPDAA